MRIAGRILLSLVVMAVMGACGAGADATASPGAEQATPLPTPTTVPTLEPTPTPDPVDAVLAACADAPEPTGEPVLLELNTIGTRFDTTHLEGPRHCEPFTIALTNTDIVWDHNVSISLIDQDSAQIFVGTSAHAPETVSYDIPGLPAGEYRFYCSPHRSAMRGTITVAPADVNEGGAADPNF